MMHFGGITIPMGPVLEAELRHVIAPSIDRDAFESLDEVMGEIERGEAIAWIATEGHKIRAACVTQIISGEHGSQCFIRHCAGLGREEWLHYLSLIELWARGCGCASIELIGRKGWIRTLQPQGYEERAVVLRKVLTGQQAGGGHL